MASHATPTSPPPRVPVPLQRLAEIQGGKDALLADALLRTASQDRQAFQQVYMLTSAKLFGVCMRICGERQAAEDVLHDVYLVIWQRAGRFEPERGTAIGWLVTIARYRSIDWCRAREYRRAAPIESLPEFVDPAPDAEALLSSQEAATRLHQSLAELNPRYRDAIYTAFFDGLSYSELAKRRGVPLGTMKSWVRRGLCQLREHLDSCERVSV